MQEQFTLVISLVYTQIKIETEYLLWSSHNKTPKHKENRPKVKHCPLKSKNNVIHHISIISERENYYQ